MIEKGGAKNSVRWVPLRQFNQRRLAAKLTVVRNGYHHSKLLAGESGVPQGSRKGCMLGHTKPGNLRASIVAVLVARQRRHSATCG